MTGTSKTREHRARELLNLITLVHRCANLPDLPEAERLQWRAEGRRALDELHHLWPHRPPWENDLAVASKEYELAERLCRPGDPPAVGQDIG